MDLVDGLLEWMDQPSLTISNIWFLSSQHCRSDCLHFGGRYEIAKMRATSLAVCRAMADTGAAGQRSLPTICSLVHIRGTSVGA